jgi:hypothetical protein
MLVFTARDPVVPSELAAMIVCAPRSAAGCVVTQQTGRVAATVLKLSSALSSSPWSCCAVWSATFAASDALFLCDAAGLPRKVYALAEH